MLSYSNQFSVIMMLIFSTDFHWKHIRSHKLVSDCFRSCGWISSATFGFAHW